MCLYTKGENNLVKWTICIRKCGVSMWNFVVLWSENKNMKKNRSAECYAVAVVVFVFGFFSRSLTLFLSHSRRHLFNTVRCFSMYDCANSCYCLNSSCIIIVTGALVVAYILYIHFFLFTLYSFANECLCLCERACRWRDDIPYFLCCFL